MDSLLQVMEPLLKMERKKVGVTKTEMRFISTTQLIWLEVKKYVTKDTLVVRDRGVKMETFSPSYIQ